MKSIIKWFFIVLLTLILGGVAALLIFKDRIIEQVMVEVNKNLAVPVDVSKVDLDFFHGFPNVSVAFYDVVLPANSDPLLDAKKIYAIIDPLTIAKGEIVIEKLEIIDARIKIIIDEQNNNNLDKLFVTQPNETNQIKDSTKTGADFNLREILLKNIEIEYINLFTKSQHHWLIHRVTGDLALDKEVFHSNIVGSLSTKSIITRTWQSKRTREFELGLALEYNIETKFLSLANSSIKYEQAEFLIDGDIILGDNAEVNLDVKGNQINFGLLKSLLPVSTSKALNDYNSKGIIDFSATLKGKITPSKLPSLVAELKMKDIDLTDKGLNANINDLNLSGNLRFDDIGDLSSGSIRVASATGKLQDQPFSMSFSLKDFAKPSYNVHFDGDIAANWLMSVIDLPYSDSGKGLINIDIRASGNLNSKGEIIESDLNGSFNFDNLSFQWADTVYIDRLAGTIQLNGDVISLSDLTIEWLQSDLTINGSIEDFLVELSSNEGRVLLLSDVKSQNLAIEDIVSLVENIPFADDTVSNNNNVRLDLELTCLFDNLSFMRYKGQNVTGELVLNDNILEVVDLNGDGLGGGLKVNGKLHILTNEDFYIDARVLTKGIYLDSMFYVFHNFDQTFITDKELKGRLYADINATMFFDSTWRFRRKLLRSEAKVRIVDGELNQFKPLMALSAYIDDSNDNLSNLRFSDLTNYITIKKDTVFIPEMSIQTNVRNIAVGGYHTLDQHINYQLAVPIINERVDKDEAFGAVKKSSKGSPNLLFRIKGTTIDYKVSYDLLRGTGNVLKLLDLTKIFKKNEEEPVDSTFLNDEVFDW